MRFFLHYSRIGVLTRKFRKSSHRILNGIENNFELVLTAFDIIFFSGVYIIYTLCLQQGLSFKGKNITNNSMESKEIKFKGTNT